MDNGETGEGGPRADGVAVVITDMAGEGEALFRRREDVRKNGNRVEAGGFS